MTNKIYEKSNGELVCVMIEGLGLCIGKLHKADSEFPMLKKPRAVQVKQGQDRGQLRLGEMIGSPDELIMIRKPVFLYEVRNKDVKDLYTQATTGLVTTAMGVIQ